MSANGEKKGISVEIAVEQIVCKRDLTGCSGDRACLKCPLSHLICAEGSFCYPDKKFKYHIK